MHRRSRGRTHRLLSLAVVRTHDQMVTGAPQGAKQMKRRGAIALGPTGQCVLVAGGAKPTPGTDLRRPRLPPENRWRPRAVVFLETRRAPRPETRGRRPAWMVMIRTASSSGSGGPVPVGSAVPRTCERPTARSHVANHRWRHRSVGRWSTRKRRRCIWSRGRGWARHRAKALSSVTAMLTKAEGSFHQRAVVQTGDERHGAPHGLGFEARARGCGRGSQVPPPVAR